MTDKICERCWHWKRIAHPLDFTLGWCGLFERQMDANQWCGMWEWQTAEVVSLPCKPDTVVKDVP